MLRSWLSRDGRCGPSQGCKQSIEDIKGKETDSFLKPPPGTAHMK